MEGVSPEIQASPSFPVGNQSNEKFDFSQTSTLPSVAQKGPDYLKLL